MINPNAIIKSIVREKKRDYSWNAKACICENSKNLKHIVDYSVIPFDEIMYVIDVVSTNITNTISTHMTNITATYSDGKKVRY